MEGIIKKHDFLAGMYVWTGFDYIGEPTPYEWPSVSSYFGIVDLAGFPKDVYYMYQSEWTDKNVLHVFPHWNWKAGQTVDVWAYYNKADEVELFVNGKSVGKRSKKGDDLHVMWRIPFEAGTLKAISRKGGKEVLVKEVKTAGAPAKIELIADRKNIKADGKDLSFITVRVVDKDGNLVYLYTVDPAKQDGFIQSATKKGYDVLLMDTPIDTHFVSQMEQKLEKTQLKRVDANTVDKLIDKGEKLEHVLSEDQTKQVTAIFEKAINKPAYKVEVEALSPDELPVTVTMDEFMRRMKDMAAMGGGMSFYGNMPDSYKVAINGNHKIVNKILASADENEQAELAKQAFDLALLSQGLLTGAELTAFVNRSVSLI